MKVFKKFKKGANFTLLISSIVISSFAIVGIAFSVTGNSNIAYASSFNPCSGIIVSDANTGQVILPNTVISRSSKITVGPLQFSQLENMPNFATGAKGSYHWFYRINYSNGTGTWVDFTNMNTTTLGAPTIPSDLSNVPNNATSVDYTIGYMTSYSNGGIYSPFWGVASNCMATALLSPIQTTTPILTSIPIHTFTPSPIPTFTPSLTPTRTPNPTPTIIPTFTPSPTSTVTPTPLPTPTPTPGALRFIDYNNGSVSPSSLPTNFVTVGVSTAGVNVDFQASYSYEYVDMALKCDLTRSLDGSSAVKPLNIVTSSVPSIVPTIQLKGVNNILTLSDFAGTNTLYVVCKTPVGNNQTYTTVIGSINLNSQFYNYIK